jgi:hypothetical protein
MVFFSLMKTYISDNHLEEDDGFETAEKSVVMTYFKISQSGSQYLSRQMKRNPLTFKLRHTLAQLVQRRATGWMAGFRFPVGQVIFL